MHRLLRCAPVRSWADSVRGASVFGARSPLFFDVEWSEAEGTSFLPSSAAAIPLGPEPQPARQLLLQRSAAVSFAIIELKGRPKDDSARVRDASTVRPLYSFVSGTAPPLFEAGWSTASPFIADAATDPSPFGPSQAALAVLTLDSGLTVAVDCAIAIEQRAYALAKVRQGYLPTYLPGGREGARRFNSRVS